jgi:hypothetical protein
MKKYKPLLVLVIVLVSSQLNANKKEDFQTTKQLFLKCEQKIDKFDNTIGKKRFVDPLEENEVFYVIVMKTAPTLYTETKLYKTDLINLFVDADIKKNKGASYNILRVLDNLCIEDYVDVIDSVYTFYKRKQVSFEILDMAIGQDFNMSNQVAKKYKNEKLQIILTEILNDIKSGKLTVTTPPYGFQETIEKILSGKEWQELEEIKKIQPPLLKQKECD